MRRRELAERALGDRPHATAVRIQAKQIGARQVMCRRTQHAVLGTRGSKTDPAIGQVARMDVIRPELIALQAVEAVAEARAAVRGDPALLVGRRLRDLPQTAAIDADLVQAVALGLRAAIAKYKAARIERKVVAIEHAARQLRHQFANPAVGQRQHAQIAAPGTDVLKIVVVVLAVVRVAFDEDDLRAAQQRIEVDQHLAPQARQFGQQTPRRLVDPIEPLAGRARNAPIELVQPLPQVATGYSASVRVAQRLDGRAEPREFTPECDQHGTLHTQIKPADDRRARRSLCSELLQFRADRRPVGAAFGNQTVDQLFLELSCLGPPTSRTSRTSRRGRARAAGAQGRGNRGGLASRSAGTRLGAGEK